MRITIMTKRDESNSKMIRYILRLGLSIACMNYRINEGCSIRMTVLLLHTCINTGTRSQHLTLKHLNQRIVTRHLSLKRLDQPQFLLQGISAELDPCGWNIRPRDVVDALSIFVSQPILFDRMLKARLQHRITSQFAMVN